MIIYYIYDKNYIKIKFEFNNNIDINNLMSSSSSLSNKNAKKRKKEDKNSYIISEYESYEISKPDIFLYICLFLTSYFLYLKITDKFIALWRVTFYPIYLYLITKTLISFYLIIKNDTNNSKSEKGKHDIFLNNSEIPNLLNIYIISNFYKFILYLLLICFIYNIHSFLDSRNDEFLIASCKFLIATTIWGLLYSLLRKIPQLKLKEEKKDKNNSIIIAFISSLLAPGLTYFSNMMIICSGGACTQIYISTITSILGAFGLTFSEISKYMFPITCILLGVSLISLYIKKRQILHGPFLLGVFSSIIIILGKYFEKSFLNKLIYPGNILMIIASIWNAKLNKFSGLPIYNKD